MKAYTYVKPGLASFVDVDKPVIRKPTDAIVRIVKTTICGTDLHIIKGDVPTCQSGTILGNEGIGIVEEVGEGVSNFKKGDKVLISCVCACGKCYYCKKGIYAPSTVKMNTNLLNLSTSLVKSNLPPYDLGYTRATMAGTTSRKPVTAS